MPPCSPSRGSAGPLWLAQGRYVLLGGAAVVLVILRLAPRSFDPAFDPWASAAGSTPPRCCSAGRPAAPPTGAPPPAAGCCPHLHATVLERLDAQTAAAQRRTTTLLEGLS